MYYVYPAFKKTFKCVIVLFQHFLFVIWEILVFTVIEITVFLALPFEVRVASF